MKYILFLLLSLNVHSEVLYEGSNFNEIWQIITSDPYPLPHYKVDSEGLFKFFRSKIKQSATRTINNQMDLLPYFDKIAHPNGICLRGSWKITEENPYGGLFKRGTNIPIIARASTTLSNTERGTYRGFALAGKLFNQSFSDKESKIKTANFFLIDNLTGTLAEHYTDVAMSNAPKISANKDMFSQLLYGLKVALSFAIADKFPGERQLYEVSSIEEKNNYKTPWRMILTATKGQTIDAIDFRDELDIENRPNGLEFDISVSGKKVKGKNFFQKIGKIHFTDSVVSESCDHRLHFHHPKWRDDLEL
ncbi:MAG: hypothetical protein H6622_17570 [Halobacteriovoraceae bacterium]|nr:hypothetical protein [Halobacteriovoraceae bacterium]